MQLRAPLGITLTPKTGRVASWMKTSRGPGDSFSTNDLDGFRVATSCLRLAWGQR